MGIQTTGDVISGGLEVTSTTQGIKIPRMTTAQRDALTPSVGETIYNTDTETYDQWQGTRWNVYSNNNAGVVKVNGYDIGGGPVKPSYSLSASTPQQITYPSGSTLVISSATDWPENEAQTDGEFYRLDDDATITANTIAFVDSNPDTITDSANGFLAAGFLPNRVITVSGSVANDTNLNGFITTNTIAFSDTNPDTITDSANGFLTAGFVAGTSITVSNSTSNDGFYRIANVAAGTLTLAAGDTLAPEIAGALVNIVSTKVYIIDTVTAGTITLISGNKLTTEAAGASITIIHPTKDKFQENTINFQNHLFRILLDYSRVSASATEEMIITIFNPLSGFTLPTPVVIPKGVTDGTLSFNLWTIADNISINNGYEMYAESTQAMTVTIDSVTRFSYYIESQKPITF